MPNFDQIEIEINAICVLNHTIPAINVFWTIVFHFLLIQSNASGFSVCNNNVGLKHPKIL